MSGHPGCGPLTLTGPRAPACLGEVTTDRGWGVLGAEDSGLTLRKELYSGD